MNFTPLHTTVFFTALISFTFLSAKEPEGINFPSADQLEITGDLYAPHQEETTPVVILFHQAGFSRGAYQEIAPKLNTLGFNCLAIDARSGKKANGVINQTAARARAMGKPTKFNDALPDLNAAVSYAAKKYPKAPILIWGSSYSASLVFEVAKTHPDTVRAVLAFSPNFLRWKPDAAKTLEIPIFITSSKKEKEQWHPVFESFENDKKVAFIPENKGAHGSRALWSAHKDNAEYWQAVEAFLKPLKTSLKR